MKSYPTVIKIIAGIISTFTGQFAKCVKCFFQRQYMCILDVLSLNLKFSLIVYCVSDVSSSHTGALLCDALIDEYMKTGVIMFPLCPRGHHSHTVYHDLSLDVISGMEKLFFFLKKSNVTR